MIDCRDADTPEATTEQVAAAIAGWRLLWAHRIDMLRDYQAAGWRVEHNLYWIGLCAAALARFGPRAARTCRPGWG